MSHNVNLQHIVFRTRYSHPTIPEVSKRQMLGYINEVSKQMKVKVLRINAYVNHIHILVDLGSQLPIYRYVKEIKSNTSRVFKGHMDFPSFSGWAKRYGSFSISRWDKERIINYIKNQEEHHRHKTFAEELAELFGEEASQDKWWRHDWLDEDIGEEVVPPALDEE